MHERACRAVSHVASRMVRTGVRAHSLSVARALSSLAAGDASLLRTAQHAAGLPTTGFTSEYACAAATLAPNDRVSPPASDDRGARRIACERCATARVSARAARRPRESIDLLANSFRRCLGERILGFDLERRLELLERLAEHALG